MKFTAKVPFHTWWAEQITNMHIAQQPSFSNTFSWKMVLIFFIPPEQRSCWGVYWFHSVRPSVRPIY